MKAILRLKGKIRPEKQRSAGRCQQSAMSYQLSAVDGWLPAMPRLLSKTYYLIPILILVFVSCGAVLAQEPVGHTAPAAQAETEITPLKIGDRIPDELWEMYFPVISGNSDDVQYLSLGDFKDKLIILDFWATWCGSCIKSLHQLDTLQRQFENDLLIIPTSYEDASKVNAFLNDRAIGLPSMFGEVELKKYFPHKSIPHQVWIRDNVVKAITFDAEPDQVISVINNEPLSIEMKDDILDYSFSEHLSKYSNQRDVPILFSSFFTGFISGLASSMSGFSRKFDSSLIINYINSPVMMMYQYALEMPNNKIALKANDIDKYILDVNDQKTQLYSYQLIMPENSTDADMNQRIIEDLNNYFKLKVKRKRVDKECYIIKKSKSLYGRGNRKTENLKQKGSYNFSKFIDLLNFSIVWTPDQPIFIDESDYDGYIIPSMDINLLKDIKQLGEELKRYGLEVVKETRPVDMFVISDRDVN